MKKLIRRQLALLCAIMVVVTSPLFAQQSLVNISQSKQAAIHGYDTVAYFTQGEPVEGTTQFSYEHDGHTWLFSNQQHLDLFTESPEKYMPQYGGFCAYAASQGARADIDPIAWRIIDDKLYLNYDLRVQKVWASNLDEYIHAADTYWSSQ